MACVLHSPCWFPRRRLRDLSSSARGGLEPPVAGIYDGQYFAIFGRQKGEARGGWGVGWEKLRWA